MGIDSVVNYEVVLADGKIVNANETSYPDLFRVLKGGANNYGIVSFHLHVNIITHGSSISTPRAVSTRSAYVNVFFFPDKHQTCLEFVSLMNIS